MKDRTYPGICHSFLLVSHFGGTIGDALGYAVEFDGYWFIVARYSEKGVTRFHARMKDLVKSDFERVTGVEPAALGLGSRCSTTELHPQNFCKDRIFLQNGLDMPGKKSIFV